MFGFDLDSRLVLGSLIISIIAVIWDLKYRKIPNWLTFPAMVLGIALNLVVDFKAWRFPLLGLLTGFLILLVPFLLGGIGAGDVKLLMALGTFLGVRTIIWTALYSAVAGGVLSLALLVKHYGFLNTKYRLSLILSVAGNRENRKVLQTPNQTSKLCIPYGLAIFIGLAVCLVWGPLGVI